MPGLDLIVKPKPTAIKPTAEARRLRYRERRRTRKKV